MKRRVLLWMTAGLAATGGFAQTHVVKKPETVVRAVAVYEWTGDEAKPTASRVVPVSLFINGRLEDAGVYLARPVPFALDTGTVYAVRKSGVDEGTLELAYERHLTAGDTQAIDDGWLGYGAFKARPKETLVARKQSGPLPKLEVSGGSKPHFSNKAGGDSATDDKGKKDDDSSGADKERPTFHKRADASGDSTNRSGASPGTVTADGSDPDDKAERPTLKRRTPAEIKADQKKKETAKVTAGSDLNDDPDRPNLHRGQPAGRMEEEDLPPLRGIPKDMHQAVAVSDAKDRPEHDFRRAWVSEDERKQVLAKMEEFARGQLAGYKGVAAAAPAAAPATPAAAAAPAKRAAAQTPAARAAAARAKRRADAAAAKAAAAAAKPGPATLADERLDGYELSYGGAPTYFYAATSPAAVAGVTRYVSVVAQEDPTTGLKVALANVTDSTHLDRTPWMRLVDVVDADASNRASLLMELRAQHTRQFALYRVIGANAEQTFVTGSTE